MPPPRKSRRLEVHEGGGNRKAKKREPGPRGIPRGFEEWPELDAQAAEFALELVRRINKSGVALYQSHRFHLIMLAELWAEQRTYRAQILKDGATVRSDRGHGLKTHPAARLLKEARERFDQIGRRFGLTPYDHERIEADPTPGAQPDSRAGETDDELEHLLSGEG